MKNDVAGRSIHAIVQHADFKKLLVWQKAHALALSIDRLTKRIRASQYASFKNQIFRAGLSIPANIAEGRQKDSERSLRGFLALPLAPAPSSSLISYSPGCEYHR